MNRDKAKPKAQLTRELGEMRQRLAKLETLKTDRRRAEAALRKNREYAQNLIDSSLDMIIAVDPERRIVEFNRAAQNAFGYSKAEVLGKHVDMLYADPAEGLKAHETARKTGRFTGEILNRKKTGETFPCFVAASVLRDSKIEFTGMMGTSRDISERKRMEEALQFTQFSIDRAADAGFWMGPDARFFYVNDAACRLLGYSREELLSMTVHDIDPDHPIEVWPDHWKTLKECGSLTFESRHRAKDGRIFPVEITINYLEFNAQQYSFAFARDITQRIRVEAALHHRVEFEKLIATVSTHFINLAPDQIDSGINLALQAIGEFAGVDRSYIFLSRNDGTTLDITHEWCCEGVEPKIDRYKGLSVEAFPWMMEKHERGEIIHIPRVTDLPPDARAEKQEFQSMGIHSVISVPLFYGGSIIGCLGCDAVRSHRTWPGDVILLLKVVGEILANALEHQRAAAQINASLKEKEVLLKEIHHRVKNNLQVISSLLNLQSRYPKRRTIHEMFLESQDRIKSMALVHERLYQSRDLARVDFAEYLPELTGHLLRSYGINSEDVVLRTNVSNALFDLDTAIPCGLIINELVSNALKHAFPAGKKGEIRIELHLGNDKKFTLTVSDDGVGMPGDMDFRHTESLGLKLARTLTDQLGGTIELDRRHGTTFKISFAEKPHKKRE